MKRALAYGIFPGFFDWPPSGLGPGGRYWDHPEYYERDRDLQQWESRLGLAARAAHAGPFRALLDKTDPADAHDEPTAEDLARSYRAYLVASRKAGLSALAPGRAP